jgi:Ca-activated chloride channel homolog
MQIPLILAAILLVAAPAFLAGQSYRGTVNEGNELYRQKQYDAAREKYERAATVEAERPESYFNSGNTAYRSDDIKAALEEYEKAGLRFRDKQRISQTLYNAGNTFLNAAEKGAENPMLQAAGEKTEDLRMEGYRQAIEMYKKALKLNPGDDDARYNLTYARKKLEDLQKQQQNQDQNKDKQQQKQKEKDKEQDQQNQDKNKQEEQQKKDQQDKDQQKQQNQKGENEQDKAKQEQQKQPQPDKDQQMSKQQAEQILRALQREEKDLQKKKRQEQGRRVDVEKDW